MVVLRPLKVVITNYPDDKIEELDAINNPEDPSMGIRKVPFTKVIFIEKDDFMENPSKKYYRLSPGNEVRLRYAYIIKCNEIIKDKNGEVIELHCTFDPETKSGSGTRSVKGTIHWVSSNHAIDAEVRLYDRLFVKEDPEQDKEINFKQNINPNSLEIITNGKLEPFLKDAKPGEKFQFERLGYFCVDSFDSNEKNLVFNRTVPLRDTWSKIEKSQKK